MSEVDPRTPVIIGVGQIIEHLGDVDYEGHSPVDLAAIAGQRAITDSGADSSKVATTIDTVGAIRQFEISSARAKAPLGRSDNYPRSVARRLGAEPQHAILEVVGGQGPQHLITELAGAIAGGASRVALVFGSEAISTARAFAGRDDAPDFTEHVGGDLDDRGYGLKGLVSRENAQHGLNGAPSQYALLENARRARLGVGRDEYLNDMAALFAPFTRIASQNPFSAAPVERDVEELATPTVTNRKIADPYLRYLVARDQVNQGAAVLISSVEAARELGVPEDRWVYLHGHADVRERSLMDRPDLSESPAAKLASQLALEMSGLATSDVATWDFYSCFPIPVFNAAVDGLGLQADDPRGLTVTGGLPFFGGAGNNYSMHAVAETVARARLQPGTFGFVGANGGAMDKYSTAVYSTTPRNWMADRSDEAQREVDRQDQVARVIRADGWAVIETYTITHDKNGRKTPIVVGRLEETNERFVALGLEGDDEIIAVLESPEPIGQRVWVLSTGPGNRVTTTADRAAVLHPITRPAMQDRYEHITVERDGHLLVVTINRPEARNALFPPAHQELSDVFDAFFEDRTLWVAILTGAGEKAFCAGNDLVYSVSGRPNWIPASGFAGLTSRRDMNKPVISAVNGYAMGGGFETALASHLIVADETATFALSEVRVGLVAGAGGVVRLPRAIPEKIANELILTGRSMTAQEGLELGVVNKVVSAGKAVEGARELAEQIMQGSPTSVRLSLQVMGNAARKASAIDAINDRSSTAAFDELMVTHDAVEGMTAFAEKRRPNWTNQ